MRAQVGRFRRNVTKNKNVAKRGVWRMRVAGSIRFRGESARAACVLNLWGGLRRPGQ